MAHQTFGSRLLGTLALSFALPDYGDRQRRQIPFGKEPGSGVAMRERVGSEPPISAAS